ncbi:isochorismatase family cysteine hydrolase [Clostridium oceanicum]|uniref:Cysteine hydrolase n=1 Tax=Clostridium oceanicum TaxID=1543 RepID=A0ABP3UNX7_9CLOT
MLEKINLVKEEILNVSPLDINELKKEDTALVVVDVIRGFSDIGVLATDRTQKIEKDLVSLIKKISGSDKIFFIDSHTKESTEFKSFPVHCLEDSEETELVTWLKDKDIIDDKSTFIKKNSTNGFHAIGFKKWLKNHGHINNYIITGVCTDICVSNFALTLKTFFDQHNLDKRIIVPINTVETYDMGSHDADLMNIFTLYNMKTNGIEIVKRVE